jgi:hypothetical protein
MPTFVEPRRECAHRINRVGPRCGAHVTIHPGGWWCPVCGARRSLADTVEVLGAPPKKGC